MVKSSNNIIERKYQKNRFFQKFKNIELKSGSCAWIILKEGRIEGVHLIKFKRFLKKLIKISKSKITEKRKKIWYYGMYNFNLQKKSKNSRMGKGKGLFYRRCLRVRRGFVLFEFEGINFNKLKYVIRLFNKFLSVKLFFYKKHSRTFPLWSNQTKYTFYIYKYLS